MSDRYTAETENVNGLWSLPWTYRLLAIDTTSARSNLALIEAIEAECRRLQLPAVRFADPVEPKANLWVTVPAADGARDGGVVLSGHTDTVPVDGQTWRTEPFRPHLDGGRLHARGSADMKSFIGVAVAALERFAASALSAPLHLALSYDEEVGCKGVGDLVAAMGQMSRRPAACIVGEPTGMRVITGHKSIGVAQIVCTGVAAHSSRAPLAVNAIEYAARAVRHVHDMSERFRLVGPHDAGYAISHSTATVNLVSGGNAINTIPETCSLTFDVRTIGDNPVEEVLADVRAFVSTLDAEMKQRDERAGARMHELAVAPALEGSSAGPAAELCAQLGGIPTADRVAFATEAGLFERVGIPTVVCGPGDIADAHREDESIELEQIARCEEFVERLLDHLRL